MSQETRAGIRDEMIDSGDGKRVSLGNVLDCFEHRSFGVLLVVFGLIAALPIVGGIPGVSVVMATLILFAVANSFFGDGSLWVPQFVRRRSVQRDKLERSVNKVRPWMEWVDKAFKERLTFFVSGRVNRVVIDLLSAGMALSFYPLSVVPYGVTAPALAVLAFGLGLMFRDGVLTLLGYAYAVITAYVLVTSLQAAALVQPTAEP